MLEAELAKHAPIVLSRVKSIDLMDDPEFLTAYGQDHPPGRKVLGFFNPANGRIYINRTMIARQSPFSGDTVAYTLRHELGHALYWGAPAATRGSWAKAYMTDPKFARFTEYSKTNAEESFAEVYMSYIASGGKYHNLAFKDAYERIDRFLGLRGKVGGKSVRKK